jgi:hypothetical protein
MRGQQVNDALAGPRALVVFGGANLIGLLPDVWLAHTSFWHARVEAVPLVVSAVGGALALVGAALGRRGRLLVAVVAFACVATGGAGFVLHLGSDALRHPPTLHRLVYSAPILAPFAYAGIGLVLAAGIALDDARARGRAALALAGLGLFGNFVLCLLDHAQNGFWAPVEWASVVAGALGGLTVLGAAVLGELRPGERRVVWIVLALMVLTAAAGTLFHVSADLRAEGPSFLDRLRYGAPVFAPALFADLALLAALGLVARGSASAAS